MHFADSMDKISKLNIFYNLADAQGIMAMVNTEAITFEPAPLTTTVTTLVPSLSPVIEILALAPEGDQLADVAATLSIEESTKRFWDEEQ